MAGYRLATPARPCLATEGSLPACAVWLDLLHHCLEAKYGSFHSGVLETRCRQIDGPRRRPVYAKIFH
jgi:hypothetical protein